MDSLELNKKYEDDLNKISALVEKICIKMYNNDNVNIDSICMCFHKLIEDALYNTELNFEDL